MNNWKKISLGLVVLALGLGFSSCKDEVEDAKDTVQEKIIGLMSASIDGEEWDADAPFGKIEGELTVITGVGLIGGNEKGIILSIKGTSEGAYTINYNPLDSTANSLNAATYSLDGINVSNPQNVYNAFDGEISITSKTDTRMSGTFSFSCANFGAAGTGTVDTIQISSGEFSNINYKD